MRLSLGGRVKRCTPSVVHTFVLEINFWKSQKLQISWSCGSGNEQLGEQSWSQMVNGTGYENIFVKSGSITVKPRMNDPRLIPNILSNASHQRNRTILWYLFVCIFRHVDASRGKNKSHAYTVVQECRKHDRQSQWGMAKFDPQPTLNPWTYRHCHFDARWRHGLYSLRKLIDPTNSVKAMKEGG